MKQRKVKETRDAVINPFKNKEIKYWADKWKVNMRIIKEAMGVTGSSKVMTIKSLLSRLNYIRSK